MSNALKQVACHRRVAFPGNVSGNVWEQRTKQVSQTEARNPATKAVSSEDFIPSPRKEEEEKRSSSKFEEERDRRHSDDPSLTRKIRKLPNRPIVIGREKLKMILASDKRILKQLVIKKIGKEGMQELLRKKRVIERVSEVKRSLYVYPEGNKRSTDSLLAYLHNESTTDGVAGLTGDFIHENLYVELGKIVLNAIQADRVSVYLINPGESTLSRRAFTWKNSFPSASSSHSQEVSSVANHVGRTRMGLLVKEVIRDKRFNSYSALDDEISIIGIPILNMNKEMIGVIELSRGIERPPFTEKHYQVAEGYIVWACLGIQQVLLNEAHKRKKSLCGFLVDVTNDMFHDITQYHEVIEKIMTHTKALVSVERCIILLADKFRNELYVEVVDTGSPMYEVPRKPFRLPMDEMNISGRVALAQRISVHNVIKSEDIGYYSNISKLCKVDINNAVSIPIRNKDCFLGVFHAINKERGMPFRGADIEVLKMFSAYFSLALHYSKAFSEMQCKENCALVAVQLLQANALTYKSSLFNELLDSDQKTDTDFPGDFFNHQFGITDSVQSELPHLYVKMVQEMFVGVFDDSRLYRFTETVFRNYRKIPYHNWEHAFMVAHCMYLVLKKGVVQKAFTQFEMIGLLIACICHDLDHRGYNNTFFATLSLPLAALYSTSVMEQHHFQMTVLILQQDQNNIFDHLSSKEYKDMLEIIQHAIISTDLALFFGSNKPQFESLVKSETFDFADDSHKKVLKAVLMTACDVCAAVKPWSQQVKYVKLLYDEFYIQGDIEREFGYEPIAMMNRENKEKFVDQQSGFMKYVVLPLYKSLECIIPEMQEMRQSVQDNVNNWIRVSGGELIPPWDPNVLDAIGTNREWSTMCKLFSVESLMSTIDLVE